MDVESGPIPATNIFPNKPPGAEVAHLATLMWQEHAVKKGVWRNLMPWSHLKAGAPKKRGIICTLGAVKTGKGQGAATFPKPVPRWQS